MKNIKGNFVILITIVLTSCSDFLERNPLDKISSETFWTNQSEVDMALTGVYARLQCMTFNFQSSFWDILGGDSYGVHNTPYYTNNIARGELTPTSGSWVETIYHDCYQGIASCNYFLGNIDNAPISDNIKDRYKGEVLFLRALFYFTLTEFYGGVPLYKEAPKTVDEAKIKQSSKVEIFNQIMADLDYAISKLPDEKYTGHAVKGTALSLKSKVLLHNEKWEEAAQTAKEVINSGNFSICDDYQSMFISSGQEGNPEIIFSTRYLLPENYSDQDIHLMWYGNVSPMFGLVNEYEDLNGNYPHQDTTNWKVNRDPRLQYSIKHETEPFITSSGYEWLSYHFESYTGFEMNKALDPEQAPVSYATRSDHDWIILRYAEVLLIYAEALNEQNPTPISEVYDAINQVRKRKSVNMPEIPEGLTKKQMRERIMHERRIEFAFEGKRFWDVKRWKTIEKIIPAIYEPEGAQWVFDPSKNYLFPFPQNEMDLNPNLEQNPGY